MTKKGILLKWVWQSWLVLPLLTLGGCSNFSTENVHERLVESAVRIDAPEAGSGVIFKREGDVYWVVTAAHAVDGKAADGTELTATVTLVAPDGMIRTVEADQKSFISGTDLAVLRFQSNQDYAVVKLGNSEGLQRGQEIIVVGSPGAIPERPNPEILTTEGKVIGLGQQVLGYGFSYDAVTQPGMSGAGVFDQKGRLIGIHGQGVNQNGGKFSGGMPIALLDGFSGGLASTSPPIQSVASSDTPSTSTPVEVDPIPEPEPPSTPQTFVEDLGNGVSFKMVKIPKGSFLMGSPESEIQDLVDESGSDWFKNESPQHRVEITQEYYMGETEVTQALWKEVMGNNPSYKQDLKNPVEQVSWDDVQEFIQKLNQRTGKQYRLPSEAEWEYAARGGTQTKYHYGDDVGQIGEYGWCYDGDWEEGARNVGQLQPNQYGLYDMIGNVWEWVEDDYVDNYQQKRLQTPHKSTTSTTKVVRGGSWLNNPENCRSADRIWDHPKLGSDGGRGFRVVSAAP